MTKCKFVSGIVSSSGTVWKEQRTFALTSLRRFGFGKKSYETKILEEVEVFLQIISETKGQPIDINIAINTSISNIICSIVLGKRYGHNDPEFIKLLDGLKTCLKYAMYAGISDMFPFMKYLPGDLFKRKLVLQYVKQNLDTLSQYIEEHKRTYDENNIRDYIDCYIKELRSVTNTSTTFTGELFHSR